MSNVWIVALVALIVGLVVGYGMGRVTLGPSSGVGTKGTYEDGYNAARTKLLQARVLPPAMTETEILSGQITSIGDNSFILTSNLRSSNPLEELNAPAERTVTLGVGAKVYRQTTMTTTEFQKQLADYQAATKAGQPMAAPAPYDVSEITFKDLQVGDSVTVAADHNILSEASFTATKVTLNARATPTAPTPAPTK